MQTERLKAGTIDRSHRLLGLLIGRQIGVMSSLAAVDVRRAECALSFNFAERPLRRIDAGIPTSDEVHRPIRTALSHGVARIRYCNRRRLR